MALLWLLETPGLTSCIIALKFNIPLLYEYTYQPCQYQIYWSSNWPCSTDCRWSWGKYGFLEFSAKKILWRDRLMPHFSYFSRTGKFRLVIRRNGSMFSADPKRVPDLQKTIHWQASKNTLLAIPFSFLKTRTKFSKFARVKKWQHWLILLIVDPRSNIQSKKSCSLKINVSRIFCLNKNRKITNRWQTNKKTKIG